MTIILFVFYTNAMVNLVFEEAIFFSFSRYIKMFAKKLSKLQSLSKNLFVFEISAFRKSLIAAFAKTRKKLIVQSAQSAEED